MSSSSISKSVIWQLLGKILLQGIAFFTTPIFTRILTPEDYGYTALYASWVSIFTLIVGLQTYGSIANARIKYEEEDLDSYLSSIMTLSLCMFFLCFILGVIFRNSLSELLGIRRDLVILAIFQSFFAYVISFYIAKLDQLKKVEKSTIVSITQTTAIIGLSLFAVIYFKENKAIVKIYSQAFPVLIIGLSLLVCVYVKGRLVWKNEYITFCLAFTLPLLIHGLGGLIFAQSDRIMITKILNNEELGIYSVSYALCNILTIIYGALNTSWLPFYMDFKKQNKNEEIIIHSKRYIKFFTIISMGFILLSYDVFKIMAPENYWSGITLLPIFTFAFYFDFLYLFPVNFEFYTCNTKLIPLATFTSALVNIGVNLLLIPKFGIIGAAVGTLIAHFLSFVLHFIVARFIIKHKFEYNIKIFLVGIATLLILIVCSYILKDLLYIRWVVAIILAVYLVIDILKNRSVF